MASDAPATPSIAASSPAAALLPGNLADGRWVARPSRAQTQPSPMQRMLPCSRSTDSQRFEKANYTRDDGRRLAIKAAVFEDASGAYGAFTFYRIPEMIEEKIGGQAGSLGNRVLFFQGNVLVDAVFDKLTAMSAAELRELAGMVPQLPRQRGQAASAAQLSAACVGTRRTRRNMSWARWRWIA